MTDGAVDPDQAAALAHLARGDVDAATGLVLRRWGGELYSFLYALARNPADADDAWAILGAKIWRGLPQFAGRASLRTWLYVLARRSLSRVTRRQRDGLVPLSQASELGRLAAEVRQTSLPHLAAVRDGMVALRAELPPDDQELLILRVDRELSWREVAEVLADDDPDLDKIAAAARKRFERIKARIRTLATERGLVGADD